GPYVCASRQRLQIGGLRQRVVDRQGELELVLGQDQDHQRGAERGSYSGPPDPSQDDAQAQSSQDTQRQRGQEIEAPRGTDDVEERQVLKERPGQDDVAFVQAKRIDDGL